jgi:fucose permease
MYGPLGSWLPRLFPDELKYTGASVAFNVAGVIGGAMTPLIATFAAARLGLQAVGMGLATAGALSFIAVLLLTGRPRPRSSATTTHASRDSQTASE